MSEIKGKKLFVNLGASRVRKRLKGFGHGVRKICSAGNNQAMVIHTASGEHLEALMAQFADVGCSTDPAPLGDSIENVRNLGRQSSTWLRQIGIQTREDLRRIGPATAFRMVKQQRQGANLNLLWAMAAGLEDRDWRELSSDAKKQLLEQVQSLD